VKKEFLVAYEVAESGIGLFAHPPTITVDSEEEDWKTKWDVLRVTIEALLYAEPALIHPSSQTKGKGKIPNGLEELLTSYSPRALVEKMYRRSLELFGEPAVSLPGSVALTLVMAGLKVGSPELSRVIAEDWFAAQGESHGGKLAVGYRKMARTYGERVLPMLEQWEDALRWIEGSELDEEEKVVSLNLEMDIENDILEIYYRL
jgi:hypothetical protein